MAPALLQASGLGAGTRAVPTGLPGKAGTLGFPVWLAVGVQQIHDGGDEHHRQRHAQLVQLHLTLAWR
jgi:hypothetical protein